MVHSVSPMLMLDRATLLLLSPLFMDAIDRKEDEDRKLDED